MAKKAKTRSPQRDPASAYRSKLEAHKTAVQEREASHWAPSLRDRYDLLFASLLHTATRPSGKLGSVRKDLLERYVFRAATRHAADRKALFRLSQSVLRSAQARNTLSFQQARNDMQGLWQEVKKRP
jgi:hypothetical protein